MRNNIFFKYSHIITFSFLGPNSINKFGKIKRLYAIRMDRL